ncbi:arylalkylamine N-acetyltransferase-like 2 [Panulirus ornatus]|uniref:arylalkylamine N-acetyltransferase-like 2 n=1 Tax=Panulirus ornatus TaxID=150431 RepID=UPI003A8ABFC1
MNEVSDLVYVVLTPGDWHDVLDLLKNHFYTRENLRLGAGIDPAQPVTASEKKYIRTGLTTEVSVGAREKTTGRLVAVLIGIIITADDPHSYQAHENVTEEERRLVRAMQMLPNVTDMFQEEGVESVLLITRMCVHPDHGRRGVARRMTQIAIDIATKKGFQLAFSRTACLHTEKLFSSLGFQTHAVLDYRTRTDDLLDLSRMSHHQVAVMAKRL